MRFEVYTDGSATTADKPGGWGYVILLNGNKITEGNGYMPNATNNDAELEAVIQGLKRTKELILEHVTLAGQYNTILLSDSQLILGWVSGEYTFKQREKLEKYHEVRALAKTCAVTCKWVEGHAGHEHNERCDKLANAARLQKQTEIERQERKDNGQTLIGNKKSGILCIWYKDCLKVIDLDSNVVENYSRDIHGTRGSMLEIKEDKHRERRS